jgi:serine/threonine protein kinase
MLNSRPANILLDADGTPKMADFGLLLSWKSWVRGRFVLWCHLFHGSGMFGVENKGLAAAVKDNSAEAR